MPALTKFRLPDADAVSPLTAMHSLREAHAAALALAVSACPGTWTLDRHEGYDGDLTVLLTPADAASPILVVSHAADGFHLSGNRDDACERLGCFGSLDSLLAAVRSVVIAAGPQHSPRREGCHRVAPSTPPKETARAGSRAIQVVLPKSPCRFRHARKSHPSAIRMPASAR
jgi:hypothetical protein